MQLTRRFLAHLPSQHANLKLQILSSSQVQQEDNELDEPPPLVEESSDEDAPTGHLPAFCFEGRPMKLFCEHLPWPKVAC